MSLIDINIIINNAQNIYYENLKTISILPKKISNTLFITESIINDNTKNEKTNSDSEKYKDIFSDNSLYKKPWNKLNPIHKNLKLKEFVNNLQINENEKKVLNDKFSELIKSKVLTKKENITYDEINGKILEINKKFL